MLEMSQLSHGRILRTVLSVVAAIVTALGIAVEFAPRTRSSGIVPTQSAETGDRGTRNHAAAGRLSAEPAGATYGRIEMSFDNPTAIESASPDLRFAAAVAQFGLVLRDSRYKGNATFDSVRSLASNAVGGDARERRAEFLDLVSRAASLKGRG
jgi:hypothetical protein